MATANQRFEQKEAARKEVEKVAKQRSGTKTKEENNIPNINTDKPGEMTVSSSGQATKLETSQVTVMQSGTKDMSIAHNNGVTVNLGKMYSSASSSLTSAADSVAATFEEVGKTLTLLLSRDCTVEQMAAEIGQLDWQKRNAQLAVLDEIENFQVVELRKLEIKDTQIDIQMKELGLKIKMAKGYLKKAISVEEVKDLENQLVTIQAENQLKQDRRNLDLNFMAGSNAIVSDRLTKKMQFASKVNEKLGEREANKLAHMDSMTMIQSRIYTAYQVGYDAYAKTTEHKSKAKATLAQRMASEGTK